VGSAAKDVARPYWGVLAFRYDWGCFCSSAIVESRYRGIDPGTDLGRTHRRAPCGIVHWDTRSPRTVARKAIPGVLRGRQHKAIVDGEAVEGDCAVTYH